MNTHEGLNTLQRPVNIKASASLIFHMWSKAWVSTRGGWKLLISGSIY